MQFRIPARSSGSSGAPELSNITIGVLPTADTVTMQIAEDKGFFKQQGLNVKLIDMTTTNQATTGLLSHTMDFGMENYVGMFEAEKSVPNLNLRIVADNAQASPDDYVLLVSKNSKLTSISQLKGKKVSFPAPGFNFGAMALDVLLQPYHMSSRELHERGAALLRRAAGARQGARSMPPSRPSRSSRPRRPPRVTGSSST